MSLDRRMIQFLLQVFYGQLPRPLVPLFHQRILGAGSEPVLNREPVLSLSTDWESEKWFVRGSYVVRNWPHFFSGLDFEPTNEPLRAWLP